MDLQANPPVAYHNFENIVAVGGQKESEAEQELKTDEPKEKVEDSINK